MVDNRISQDRRKYMRVIARLDCQFAYNGVSHKGVVVDISLKGALLSSVFLPPVNGEVSIRIETPHLPEPLMMDGRVQRGNWGMTDHGKVGRFGVEFKSSPLALIKLINTLLAPQKAL